MLPRVWAPDLDPVEKRARLPADESAHVTRVLRLGPGDRVLVFDGRGAQYLGELTAIASGRGARAGTRGPVTVTLGEPVPAAAEPRVALTLAQAVLKGDKMDAVVRDATMMGLSRLVPIVTDRTVVPLSALEPRQEPRQSRRPEPQGPRYVRQERQRQENQRRENQRQEHEPSEEQRHEPQGRVLDRWHRVAVASAKQCGRAIVPEIAAPTRFPAWLASTGAETRTDADALRLLLVEPSAADPPQNQTSSATLPAVPALLSLPALPEEPPARVAIAIGPEGGWSPEEIAAARAAGCVLWTLGARTLRAESAALAALSVLTYVWRL